MRTRITWIFLSAAYALVCSNSLPAEQPAKSTRTKRTGQQGNAGEYMPPEMTKSSDCKAAGKDPDPDCTPGAVMGISMDVICTTSTKGRRAVTEAMKNQVYKEYGITTHSTGMYEVDHFIPLELGGSNDIANLWPEPANPKPGFHEKDKVETALHDEVCKTHTMTLEDAQRTIATNWLQYYNDKIKK